MMMPDQKLQLRPTKRTAKAQPGGTSIGALDLQTDTLPFQACSLPSKPGISLDPRGPSSVPKK